MVGGGGEGSFRPIEEAHNTADTGASVWRYWVQISMYLQVREEGLRDKPRYR